MMSEITLQHEVLLNSSYKYQIESHTYKLIGGVGGHSFWVLRNVDTGAVMAEAHGLAWDLRVPGTVTLRVPGTVT